jgi:coenzyme A diphosphatase NUDT7
MASDLAFCFHNRKPRLMDEESFTRSAVLLPLLKAKTGEWQVLFEVRSHELRSQPGEICFPGGRVDPGEEQEKTALRETAEELGLPPEAVNIWGELDFIISPLNHILYSFVGEIQSAAILAPNPAEVAEIFTVPLSTLLTLEPEIHYVPIKAVPAEDFPFHKIPGGRNYTWRKASMPEVFYEVDGRIIWGLTARILKHFLEIISG